MRKTNKLYKVEHEWMKMMKSKFLQLSNGSICIGDWPSKYKGNNHPGGILNKETNQQNHGRKAAIPVMEMVMQNIWTSWVTTRIHKPTANILNFLFEKYVVSKDVEVLPRTCLCIHPFCIVAVQFDGTRIWVVLQGIEVLQMVQLLQNHAENATGATKLY